LARRRENKNWFYKAKV